MAWSSDYAVESARQDMKLMSEIRRNDQRVLAPVSAPNIHGHGGLGKRYSHQMVSDYDELDADEFGEDLSITTPTEKKKRLSPDQVRFLEISFGNDIKLEPERKAQIAKELGLQPRQVAIWFQNRRVRWKNKQTEQDYEALKAKYEVLLKENGRNIEDKKMLIKENEELLLENRKLQAKVARLTTLFQRSSDSMKLMSLPGFDSDHDSGLKEFTSATKSSDVSDIQDSGNSAPAVKDVTITIVNPLVEELSSVICTAAMTQEPDHLYHDTGAEETVINPFLLQHLINAEDIFSFSWYDQSHPLSYGADNGRFITP